MTEQRNFNDILVDAGGRKQRIFNLINQTIEKAILSVSHWKFSLELVTSPWTPQFLDREAIESMCYDHASLPDKLVRFDGIVFANYTCPRHLLNNYQAPSLYDTLEIGIPYEFSLISDGTPEHTRTISCHRVEQNAREIPCLYSDFMCDEYNCVFVNNYEFRRFIEDWLEPDGNYYYTYDENSPNEDIIFSSLSHTLPYHIDGRVKNELAQFILNTLGEEFIRERLRLAEKASHLFVN